MAQSVINSDVFVSGALSAKSVTLPSGCVTDAAVQAAAYIQASKLYHQNPVTYYQVAGSSTVSQTVPLYLCYGASGTVLAIQASLVVPCGAFDTVTIDLKKGNASTAYATVLTAPMLLDSTKAARVVVSGTLASASMVQGDQYELVVTVSGASPQGLLVSTIFVELPQ